MKKSNILQNPLNTDLQLKHSYLHSHFHPLSLKQNHPLWPNIKHAPWKTLHKLSLSLSLSLHHYQNPTINLPLPKKLQPDMLISFQHRCYCYNESVSTLTIKKKPNFLIFIFMSTGMEQSLLFMLCFGQVKPFWRVPNGLRDGSIFLNSFNMGWVCLYTHS